MSYLSTYLNLLDFSSHLQAVNTFLNPEDSSQAPTVRITFWGCRVVEWRANNIAHSISLDNLAKKVLKAGGQRCAQDDLTLEERVAGIEIQKKVINFYQITDHNIENLNCLTKLLLWIREFSFNPCTTRFYLETTLYFQTYYSTTFSQIFHGFFERFHPDLIESRFVGCSPETVVAKEESIRRVLNEERTRTI